MNSTVEVIVNWEEEKMSNLPLGSTYTTLAKFDEDAATWPSEGWSIVLNFDLKNSSKRSFEATARFLAPNAPWERLRSGCVFEMYEGLKRTATVKVL